MSSHPYPIFMTDITNQSLYPFPLNLKSASELFSKRSLARLHGIRLNPFVILGVQVLRERIIQKSSWGKGHFVQVLSSVGSSVALEYHL